MSSNDVYTMSSRGNVHTIRSGELGNTEYAMTKFVQQLGTYHRSEFPGKRCIFSGISQTCEPKKRGVFTQKSPPRDFT